jgi:hypothetical protein
MEMSLQIHDRTIAVVPERLVVVRRVCKPFADEKFAVHADDQHLLVIGSIEDADPPAFRQIARGAPEKIVLQFRGTWMLEAEYLAALRIDPGHHVLDGAILSGRIEGLKNQQNRVVIGCVEKLLLCAELRNVLFQEVLVLLFRHVYGLDDRRPLSKVCVVSFPHPEILRIDLHPYPFGGAPRLR